MTTATRFDPLDISDEAQRGVNYTQYLTLRQADGTGVDLSAYTVISLAVQGPGNVTPESGTYFATYDGSRGGAAGGAVTVFIEYAVLETGWRDDDGWHEINWSVKGRVSPTDPEEFPIFNCTLTVEDTAFV